VSWALPSFMRYTPAPWVEACGAAESAGLAARVAAPPASRARLFTSGMTMASLAASKLHGSTAC
jgi:hypothetical protein